MFDGLFDNRNRTVSDLIKLGDYLGRSLRENVSIFKIDTEDRSVCYVTQSNKVIVGNYTLGDQLALDSIIVEDAEVFSDNNKFDSMVDGKISSFVKNIYEDNHKRARSTFDDILYLWESRLKFKNVQQKLVEKSAKFNDSNSIVESQEFQQFLEIAPELVDYLRNNKAKIAKISDIRNAVRLSQTVSEAFNVPKMDYETLGEVGSFSINESADGSIYEMICKQELIKKELLEHKANFDSVWASNQKVQALAGLIYSDEETVNEALVAAIEEVPYLALASKKQLTETFKNSLNLNGMKDVSINDIQEFASFIFEQKKPARTQLVKHLNERYGVNVQNLKEPASFRSLLNTQVVIFETLSKISPKGSVQREVLSNLAEMLKSKNGVEAIDVNDVIQEVFQAAGYEGLAINESLERFLEVEKLKELGKIIQMATGGSSVGAESAMTSPAPQMPTPTPPAPQGMDDDDVSVPPEAMTQGDEEEEATPEMGEEGMEEEMPEDVPPPSMSDEDLLTKMSELEQLLSNLRSEISGEEGLNADLGDDEEEGMEEEMPEEEGEEESEDIDAEQEELDSEEDEIEAEHEQAHEMENEAEAKEEKVRSKQKAAEKKEDNMKKGG
jgi:hypothetical protein